MSPLDRLWIAPLSPLAKMFRSNLFGVPAIVGPDGPLGGRASQRHRLALVALLSAAGPKGLPRERLAHLLWPDAESDKVARRLLSDSIYRVNQAAGGEALTSAGEAVRLDLERLPSDISEFASALEEGDWERAVKLHDAPFMDGFVLPSAPFEHWLETERRRLHREKLRALKALASADDSADSLAATHWWRLLAAEDPYSSNVALGLMQALERQGERSAAVEHAQAHTALVRGELGLEPDPDIVRYADELRAAPAGGTSKPVLRPPAQVPKAQQNSDRPAVAEDSTPLGSERLSPTNRSRVLTWLVAGGAMLAVAAAVWVRVQAPPVSTGGDFPRSSVVVLPFADNSPASDQEYFADGMTDELIARLSAVPGIRVVGRTSAFAFKGRQVDVREIGRQLNVGAILEGSVARVGQRLQVSAQLVDATDGFELWSETYEREVTDLFQVQDDIARGIVNRLAGEGAFGKGVAVPSTDDAEAFALYLRGRFEWHKRSEDGLRRAAELFEEALVREPGFARAHAGLADAYAVLGFYDYLAPREAFPRATRGALRAIDLDPDLAEPYATLGYSALYYDWDPVEAERWFRQSLSLDPGYSTGHQWYANLLLASARFDEAAQEMRVAQERDPLSRIASAALGFIQYHAGEHERALRQLELTLDLDPDFEVAHLWLGAVHGAEGRHEEAVASFERAVSMSGSAISRASLARGLALAGEQGRARELLAELEREAKTGYAPTFEIAKVYEAIGERDRALDRLRSALAQRSHSMVFLATDPQLKSLWGDPAFLDLIAQVPVARLAYERLTR